MPNLAATITGFVKGDDLDIVRSVSDIPVGQTVTNAILTIKSDVSSSIIIQKQITSTLSAGVGQITDTGAGGTAVVKFFLTGGTAGDTTDLDAETAYPYDIQLKTSANKHYTPEKGTITAVEEVTIID